MVITKRDGSRVLFPAEGLTAAIVAIHAWGWAIGFVVGAAIAGLWAVSDRLSERRP
ncbi:MAG: hypothetical protein ACREDF_00685 [Thermoplasmata archaeon]